MTTPKRRNDEFNRKGLQEVESTLSDTPNPSSSLNVSGYQNNLDKVELETALLAVEELGYEICVPRHQTVTEFVSIRSVLQVIDCAVAHAVQKYPNLFTTDLDVTDVQISPIELKTYFTLLFLNRMRAVNQLTGDAVGNIPYIADEAPMPRALFEMFSALAPYKEGNQTGVLAMEYREMMVINECIFGPTYVETDLCTPACPSLQAVPGDLRGIHCLAKDSVYGEVVVIETSPLFPKSIGQFWTEDVEEDRLFFAVNQIYEITFPYNQLPAVSVSADFFACSRAIDGVGRPANQLMSPFHNYDENHATVFSFFKRCEIRATMNQKVSMQAPTRPNDTSTAAQYPKEYCVGVFVSQGDRLRETSTSYLGSRKYYKYDGKDCRPAPQYKKVDPEMIKTHCVDSIRALQSALAQAIRAQSADLPANSLDAVIVNSPRFYKEACLSMVSKIFKSIQLQCLAFMTNPSQTAMSNQANEVQLFGSAAMVFRAIAPIVDSGNFVLPFFEFGNLSLTSNWFDMDRFWNALPGTNQDLYGSTLTWSAISAQNNVEFLVHFGNQVVDQAWVTGYTGVTGWRKIPFYAVTCSKNYERMIEAFSVASGMWLNMDPPTLGGSPMLTFTKYVRDLTVTEGLPVFDTDQSAGDTPYPIKYLLTVERLLFMNFVFGLPLSETTVAVHSLDILTDDADDLNEFPYASPLNLIPGSQNPWSLFNSDVANSNGVIQKAYAANISRTHSQTKYLLGVPVIPKNDDNMCFWDAVSSALGSIGDAVLSGVNTFVNTGNIVAGVVDTVSSIATDVFTSDQSLFYDGSPSLKAPDVLRQRSTPGLYSHSRDPHKRGKEKNAVVNAKKQVVDSASSRSRRSKSAPKAAPVAKKQQVKQQAKQPVKPSKPKQAPKIKSAPKKAPVASRYPHTMTSSQKKSFQKNKLTPVKKNPVLPKNLKPKREIAPTKVRATRSSSRSPSRPQIVFVGNVHDDYQ
jgi:hypothetical protein